MMTNQMTILTSHKRTFISQGQDTGHPRASNSKEKLLRKSTHPSNNANKHSHSNLLPFGIVEKRKSRTISKHRVFAITTSWVMVKNQPVIHSSICYDNEIGHPNHAEKTESKREVRQSNNAKPIHKQENQSQSNIHKQSRNQCFESAHRIAKQEGNRMQQGQKQWDRG